MRDLVFVHSPLLGRSSWAPTVQAFTARGWRCHAPTAHPQAGGADGAPTPRWRDWPALLARALGPSSAPILIGHSAAGLLLPALADLLDAAGLVFVDARLPDREGRAAPAEDAFLEFIRSRADDAGRLPPWSRWWGEDRLAASLPGAARAALDGDAPRLTLDWFHDEVEIPAWSHRRAGYVRFSASYDDEAAQADARGLPVVRVAGHHLLAMTDPDRAADAIAVMLDAFERAPGA